MKFRIIVLFILITHSFSAQAQRGGYYSANQKAVRQFEAALDLYNRRFDEKALDAIEQTLQTDPNFIEAYLLRANIYESKSKLKEAAEDYRKSISIDSSFFPNTFYTLSKLEFDQGDYANAKKHASTFLLFQKIKEDFRFKANIIVQSCAFSDSALKHPVPFNPINLGDSINTANEEYLPAITADGAEFLFTRRLATTDDYGRKSYQEDFFLSVKNNKGEWLNANPVTDINTRGNEGAPALSADGNYLFFTACKEMEGYPGGKTGKGSCDLFISKRSGNKFDVARNLESPINTGTWESQPSFSSDGRTLYFIRRMPSMSKDTKGQIDILTSKIADDGQWSEPVSVSDNINTPGDEMSVFIHPDDQTLYFSSNGHPGMGGLDIFFSRRQADGSWGKPVNIGYPINTSADDNSLLVDPGGKVAYFSSNRPGGKGGLDIYQFDLYEKARPQLLSYMKGKVADAETKILLGATFELIDLVTGNIVVSSSSDSKTGEFLVCLPSGKSYALNVSKDGYLFYSENFELKNPKSSASPVLKDIFLKPIKQGESIVLKNIFFETNQSTLRDESKTELNKLISFMKKNLAVRIEISGHTDSVGDKKSNQLLSERRAQSVTDYLTTNGIDGSRLSAKGYGDTKPIAPNTDEAGRAKNRRTEATVL